jgi:hypothetical protein
MQARKWRGVRTPPGNAWRMDEAQDVPRSTVLTCCLHPRHRGLLPPCRRSSALAWLRRSGATPTS